MRGRTFYIFTGATEATISSYLAQVWEEWKYHPIAYANKKLQVAEVNYTYAERVCLSMVYAT